MAWLKTKCTWSSHWDSRHMTGSHMCTNGRKVCTDESKYGRIDIFPMSLNFTKSKVDFNLFDKIDDGDDLIHRILMDTGGS